MGNSQSAINPYSTNDFELVIRLSKDLEHVLKEYFNARGSGLGEYIRTANCDGRPLSAALKRQMSRLNQERNMLIHDLNYNSIADRNTFISDYESAVAELKRISTVYSASTRSDEKCVIQ